MLDPFWTPYSGLLDEVQVFDRALSAGEIQAIANAGAAGEIKGVVVQNGPAPRGGSHSPSSLTWSVTPSSTPVLAVNALGNGVGPVRLTSVAAIAPLALDHPVGAGSREAQTLHAVWDTGGSHNLKAVDAALVNLLADPFLDN
jgi:hypothetical protein